MNYKLTLIHFIGIIFGLILFSSSLAEEIDTLIQEDQIQETPVDELVMPDEQTDWNDRFIFTELQKIRTKIDTMKQEIYNDVQKRELETIDRALSYSANTLNYFFIFISIIIMGLGLVGWKAISSVKEMVKENMEKEMNKVLTAFQEKMEKIEEDQQVNILWRGFGFAEQSSEKLDILDQIKKLKSDSRQMLIERSNVYLEMELYSQCVEVCNEMLVFESGHSHTLYNRATAYMNLEEKEKAIEDIEHLLKVSPDYRENLLEDDIFQDIWSKI